MLFSSAVRTGCGTESAEVGPFYCPADQTVYLDLAFFKDMEQKFGVKGDFSQADCYAGVWAHSAYTRDLLQPGDLDEALTAAAAVGDDFQQKQATGSVQPEQWTHGTSAQRQKWLTTGYDKGEPAACDTFSAGP